MRPFNYNETEFGGTEYMGRGWHKHIAQHMPKLDNYLAIIIPGIPPSPAAMMASDKEILVWIHNTPKQFHLDKLNVLRHPKFLEKVKYFIVPSEEHKRLVLLDIPIEPERVYVIPNAIDPLRYNPEKFDKQSKVRLINTSRMERGIEVLLNAVPLIQEDFELDIFCEFNPTQYPEYVPDERLNFYNFSYKGTVRKHYEKAHIHSYPSTYVETFCISQIESMSAGLVCVTSDLGALPEISHGFGRLYPFEKDPFKHSQIFAEQITLAIQDIKAGNWDPTEQIRYINETYSWEAVIPQWIKFHDLL